MSSNRLVLFAALSALPATVIGQDLGGLAVATTADGNVAADTDHYRATFTRERSAIAVPAPADSATLPQLELRFVGAVRGGRTMATDRRSKAEHRGDYVEFARGGLRERYRLGAQQLEQSFVISEHPEGVGDLEVMLAVGGNVSAPPMPAEHRAITFAFEGTPAIRYGEAFVLDRGGANRRIATSYDGLGTLSLIVPAEFLDAASYPVIIDPAIGIVRNPGGPQFDDTKPDVVYDRHYTDEYFVVWQRRFTANLILLRGQLFDRNGIPTSGTIPITTSGVASNPAAVMNRQSHVLVVYEANDRIEAVRYNPLGNYLRPSFVVSEPAPGERDRRPAVTGHHWHSDFTVAWDRTPAGGTTPQAIVARHWESQSGHPTPGPEQVLESVPASAGHVRNVRMPTNCGYRNLSGNTYELLNRAVWDRFYASPAPGDYDVRTCSFRWVNVWGGPLPVFTMDQAPSTLAGAIGGDELLPSIGSRDYASGTGMSYCIAWEDEGDVRGRMYDQNGASGAPFDIRATPDYQGQPAVGAGFCEFTVAYAEIPANASFAVDVRAARVLADGTVTVNDRPIDVGSGKYQEHIRAACGEWQSSTTNVNSTMIVWQGQTGPAGPALNDIRARVFEPVDALSTWYGSGCSGPGGLTPQIDQINRPVPGGSAGFLAHDAPANAVGLLFCSNQLVNLPIVGAPGCNLYAAPPFLLSQPLIVPASGLAQAGVRIPCRVPLGVTVGFQFAFLTPGHNGLGLITTGDIDVTWVE